MYFDCIIFNQYMKKSLYALMFSNKKNKSVLIQLCSRMPIGGCNFRSETGILSLGDNSPSIPNPRIIVGTHVKTLGEFPGQSLFKETIPGFCGIFSSCPWEPQLWRRIPY